MNFGENISRVSTFVNKLLFHESYPVCYTAYREKWKITKFFNTFFFWEKDHCRKVYLSRRIHDKEINKK